MPLAPRQLLAFLPPPVRLLLAAAAASLVLYGVRSHRPERRTPAGVEQRLFGLGGREATLVESDPGGRWLVCLEPGGGTSSRTPAARTLLGGLTAPGPGALRPPVEPLPEQGSWELKGARLRYRWRRAAQSWDRGYLLAESPSWEYEVLDLRSGRTLRGEAARRRVLGTGDEDGPYFYSDELRYVEVPRASALEELPAPASDSEATRLIGDRQLLLRWRRDGTGALQALAGDEVVRVLPVAERAVFLELSGDGRTLFFRRDGALCRLRLRRPLPELVEEVAAPPLPELEP